MFFYACDHQQSNEPCPQCHPGEPVMPDDWVDTYVPPGVPGQLTDAASIG